MTPKNRFLNVGCGSTFHPEWVNLDARAVAGSVISWDLRRGLPFSTGSFDACYSSHVLEHLEPVEGARLLREMHRVVKPGGVVRIAVPDLELIAKDYLHSLESASRGAPGADDDYDWMMIQLLDQSVRRRSGGAMAAFWRDPARSNYDFVVERGGLEAATVISESRNGAPPPRRSLFKRLASRSPNELLTEVRHRVARALVHLIAGHQAAGAFDEGRFRNSGEIHQWMYDRYSLARALRGAGFSAVEIHTANDSGIAGFARYELDSVAGRARKPDSLFMEGVKDSAAAVKDLAAATPDAVVHTLAASRAAEQALS